MDVTIVIPTKNGGELLDRVLTAIEEQETNYSYETICIDSGSKDNTISYIKKHNCTLYEISPSEFGHGKTRNFGASKGTGEFIIFITQDALPASKTWLQNFIDAMKIDPDIVGGFGIHYPYPDCNLFDKHDLEMHFKGFGDKNTIYYMEDSERYQREEGYRHLLSFYSDNNSCMKRSIWEKYPYDDVDFAEDQIWARKMIELGYKKVYCPFAPVYHSHNYKLTTYFSRYYDEYKGLWNLHHFQIAKTWRSAIKQCYKRIIYEWGYVILKYKLGLFEKIKWLNYSFWRNHCRYIAGFIGGRYHSFDKEKQLRLDKKYSQQYKQIRS